MFINSIICFGKPSRDYEKGSFWMISPWPYVRRKERLLFVLNLVYLWVKKKKKKVVFMGFHKGWDCVNNLPFFIASLEICNPLLAGISQDIFWINSLTHRKRCKQNLYCFIQFELYCCIFRSFFLYFSIIKKIFFIYNIKEKCW